MEFLGDSMDLTLQCCIWNFVYSKLPGKVGVVNIIEYEFWGVNTSPSTASRCGGHNLRSFTWISSEFWWFMRSSEFWSLGYLNVGTISHLSRSVSRFFWVGNTKSQSLSGWLGSMANEGRETSEGCYWSDDLLLGWMEVVEKLEPGNSVFFENATIWHFLWVYADQIH